MEGDTKKNQVSNTHTSLSANPSTQNNPETPTSDSVNFSSHDIGRTTVAHKDHTYFTNVKKNLKETLTKKHIIIISIITLLIIGTIITIFFFTSHQTTNSDDNSSENTSNVEEDKSAADKTTAEHISQYANEIGTLLNEENENTIEPTDDNQPGRLSQIKEDLQATSTSSDTSEENRIEAINLLTLIYTSESQYLDAIAIIENSLTENKYSDKGEFSLLCPLASYYERIGDTEKYKVTLQRIVANFDRSKIPDNTVTTYYKTELENLNNAQ